MSTTAKWQEDNRDWLVLNGEEIERPELTYTGVNRSYDQKDIHKYSCTLHGVITVVANNFGVKFSLEERQSIFELALERGFQKEWGWYIQSAIKCVRDWCRDNKDLDLAYFQINWRMFEDVAKKGFGIIGGYSVKKGMSKDKNADGILGNDINYGIKIGGHCVSYWNIGGTFSVVNNYPSTAKYNVFEIQNLKQLVARDVVYKYGYILKLKNKPMTNLDRKLTEEFEPRSLSELRRIVIDWGEVKNFEEGLRYVKKPANLHDLKEMISLVRLKKDLQ